MKIIIYGIMDEPRRLEIEYLLDDSYEVAAYTDYDYDLQYFGNRQFIRPENLAHELDFDYIIIASYDDDFISSVSARLKQDGICANKIIQPYFFTFKDRRLNQNILDNFKRSQLEFSGIIMGNSYALRGIEEEFLTGCWYNMGWHGLDLYYCYKLLLALYTRQASRMNLIKKILLVMPYYFFNYDMSNAIYSLKNGQCWAVSELDDSNFAVVKRSINS